MINLKENEQARIDELILEWISLCLPPGAENGAPATGFGVVLKTEDGIETLYDTVDLVIRPEERMVFSILYAPNHLDAQKNYVKNPDVIKKALWGFMKEGKTKNIDLVHNRVPVNGAYLAEAYTTRSPNDPLFPNAAIGSAIVGIKIDDDAVWAKFKNGELGGISLSGRVGYQVEPLEEKAVEMTDESTATIKAHIGRLHGETKTTVQSIMFLKSAWTVERAVEWLKKHGYRYDKVDEGSENAEYIHFRQREQGEFQKDHQATIDFDKTKKTIEREENIKVENELNIDEGFVRKHWKTLIGIFDKVFGITEARKDEAPVVEKTQSEQKPENEKGEEKKTEEIPAWATDLEANVNKSLTAVLEQVTALNAKFATAEKTITSQDEQIKDQDKKFKENSDKIGEVLDRLTKIEKTTTQEQAVSVEKTKDESPKQRCLFPGEFGMTRKS